MAKRRRNKAAIVRAYLTEKPESTVKEVVEALRAKKVRVLPNHVYQIKAKMRGGADSAGGRNGAAKKGRGKALKGAGAMPSTISVINLQKAKIFVEQIGSVQAAVEAIAVLSTLK